MKFNWGTGIFIFYTLFAITLISMVIRSTQYDHSLVAKDYYAEDLAYQSTFVKMENSLSLENPPVIKHNGGEELLRIQFSDKSVAPIGTVHLYRPNNEKLDKYYPVKIDAAGLWQISTKDLAPGYWKVKLAWQAAGTDYLDLTDFIKP
jgi:hypothetical protein